MGAQTSLFEGEEFLNRLLDISSVEKFTIDFQTIFGQVLIFQT